MSLVESLNPPYVWPMPNLFPVLYLTMRFAKTIKQIQGLQAYHAGDKLIVEVDIVLDASTPLKDSHDLR